MRLWATPVVGRPIHVAGILQYSEKLKERIEKWLLGVYAPIFIKALEATAAASEKHLKEVERALSKMDELAQRLARDPKHFRWTGGGHGFLRDEDMTALVEWLRENLR